MRGFRLVLMLSVAHALVAAESVYSQPPDNRPASEAGSSVSPTQHLKQIFAEVSREDRGLRKSYSRYFSSSHSMNERLQPWSLDTYEGPLVRRSLPLHALVIDLANAPRSQEHQRRTQDEGGFKT